MRYDVLMAVMSAMVIWNVTPCGFGNCLQDYIPSQPRRSQSTNTNLTLHEAYRRNNKFSQICLAVQQNCRFNKTEISPHDLLFSFETYSSIVNIEQNTVLRQIISNYG
jgi:hypothetical protein